MIHADNELYSVLRSSELLSCGKPYWNVTRPSLPPLGRKSVGKAQVGDANELTFWGRQAVQTKIKSSWIGRGPGRDFKAEHRENSRE